MSDDVPRISVIVSPIHDGRALPGALAALEAQVGAPTFEVIVPIDSSLRDVAGLRSRFPAVRFVEVEGTAELARSVDMGIRHEAIDRRRAEGLRAARADIIALTEEHARPAPDWCASIASAHAELPHAVIGGAIENVNPGIVNQALFLVDAGRYQNPLPAGPAAFVSDINVSYKRAPLFEVEDVWRQLYNETRIHDALRARGLILWLSPSIVVHIDRGSLTAGHALREAFAWARLFAGRRTFEAGMTKRTLLALTAPLLFPLLLLRQTRIAVSRGRVLPFLGCLPFLVLVDAARAAGEWVGYVTGREAGLRGR